MGDTKKPKKQYERPRKPWDRTRLDFERKLKADYGLRNKRELRRLETIVRRKRQNARLLLAMPLEERQTREKELMQSLERLGLVRGKSTLDDVLSLSVSDVLERRLQTQVVRKGLGTTMKQSRQIIVHGHVGINGKKVSSPNYIVLKNEESAIAFYGTPLNLLPPKSKEELKKKFDAAKGVAQEKAAVPQAQPEIAASEDTVPAQPKEKPVKEEA